MDLNPWCAAPRPRHGRTPAAGLRRGAAAVLLGLLAALAATWPALAQRSATPASPSTAAPPPAALPEPTGAAQRIYERTRPLLLQIRTLLATQDSQATVGSGFVVDEAAGLVVSNYHVVSRYALEPRRHRLVYAGTDGSSGALQLLAFDVINDLALLRLADPAPLRGRGAVALRPADEAMPRGARMFALGNPLDVGFAVSEGNYNGFVERSFLPRLFFGGSLSGGMSGGPALDEAGRLIGVNVAVRRDGEQVSFLVPAQPVRALLARGRGAEPITAAAHDEVARQLLAHQQQLADAFIALSWRSAGHARYRIPVPQERFLRCWGRGSAQASRGLEFERSDCAMDSRVYVNERLLTGFVKVRHEVYDGRRIGALRFAHRHSASFGNEFIGFDERERTAAQCEEATLDRDGLPLRSVVCLRAYKKLPGLFDLTVMTATLDGSESGAQGRFDAYGVSAANAQRLAQHYLEGFAWTAPPASR